MWSQVGRITTVDQYNRTALHYCATNRQTLVVDLLLKHWRQTESSYGPSILEMRDCDGLTALAHAVIAGNHTMIEHLLMMGADVTCRDDERHTLMHFATGFNLTTSASLCKERVSSAVFYNL